LDLIAALDILVLASHSEGSSVVAMEGMSRSRPVVATAVGGVPEVVADNETGILVAPGDVTALAQAVTELLVDPERRQQLGERGRQRVRQLFDVADMVEKTKSVYADLMRDRMIKRGHK
jgi:glycosyltransferase involved in cell wall biosynthesis